MKGIVRPVGSASTCFGGNVFPQLRSGTVRAVFWGLAAAALVFGSSQLVGAASPLQATAPTLGQASSFAVLGGSTVTNTGTSTILADVGLSPGTAVTGFPPGLVVGGTIHAADALAAQAQDATTTAYNALAAQTCTLDLSGLDLGLQPPLAPGVYCFSSSAQLTGTLTLNATGNGVYVFKIGSTLTTASNSSVLLIGPSASACNVFWQVTSSATLGTGTSFVGNIIALTSITLTTGANISGRALARNGAVTLDTNVIGTNTCVVGLPTATPTAIVPPAAPFRPSQPAATVTPPTPTPTLSAAAATATTSTVSGATATANAISAGATATAVSAATTATAVSAATTATAVTVAAGVAAAAPATPTATPPSAVTAPAPQVPAPALTPVPTATMPPPQVPTALPRTGGGGLPPVGLFSLLLGGLAVALAMTVRRTRK